MASVQSETQTPDHVPPHLVRDNPLVLGRTTTENPFTRIIPEMTAGPDIFYSADTYLGIEPGWVFRRAEHLRAIYRDYEHFSNQDMAPFGKLLGEDWCQLPVESDPPRHTAYRNLLNPLFAPQRMARLEEKVRAYARQYIERFKSARSCDFMSQFAFEYPIAVFLELMGLPQQDVGQLLAWEYELLHEPDMQRIAVATRSVKNYLLERVDERRGNPRDDLISHIATATIDGEPLHENAVIGLTFGLYLGGLDTVSSNMGLHFRHLAENIEHQRQLRARPEDIPLAIEEFLRAYAAVTTSRICISPVEVGGVRVMPGDRVAMSTTLAGRDEAKYDRPHDVILDRKPPHDTFAHGPHRCVGMHLARREMHIGMAEFLAAIPEFRLDPDVEITTSLGGVIQPDKLPLIW